MEQVIFDEEYFRARAPVLPTASALNLLGPTLIHWGMEDQKKQHLPRILSADELWCQGYSEPDAGGDLASLRTRAVDLGDHFVVNGQKVWTSGAHFADWCFLLVRTDPDAPKHHGISYLLVDMKTPGITVRPLVLLNGHRHFNEVFFEDVAVPKENLIGPLNQGWKVAITTLMFERSGAGGRDHAAQIARLAELAKQFPNRQEPAWNESHIRQQLAQLAIDVKALQVTRLRGLTRRLRGEPPGPEGSILKLFGSELALRIADFSSTLLGPYATVDAPTEAVPDAARWHHRVLGARQYTIAGGTSEIQRNIIGERVLGLPKG
jgi:alkylation response protein AidB-like acyl-CoA dehydrogenase